MKVKLKPKKKNKPGEGALREIRRQQRSTKLAISRIQIARFACNFLVMYISQNHIFLCIRIFYTNMYFRVIRDISREIGGEHIKWRQDALKAIHCGLESFLVKLMENSNLAAIHARQVTIQQKDIQLVIRITKIKEAYKMDEAVTGVNRSDKIDVNENQRKKELEKLKDWKQKGGGKRTYVYSDSETDRNEKRKKDSSKNESEKSKRSLKGERVKNKKEVENESSKGSKSRKDKYGSTNVGSKTGGKKDHESSKTGGKKEDGASSKTGGKKEDGASSKTGGKKDGASLKTGGKKEDGASSKKSGKRKGNGNEIDSTSAGKKGKGEEKEKIVLCGLRWFKLNVSKYQKDVKLSKRCQMSKNETPRLWRRFTKKLN